MRSGPLSHTSRSLRALGVQAVLVTALLSLAGCRVPTPEVEGSDNVALAASDPAAFETAGEMYARKAVPRPADDALAGLLEWADVWVKGACTPEEQRTRAALTVLAPYASTSQVQEAVKSWVDECTPKVKERGTVSGSAHDIPLATDSDVPREISTYETALILHPDRVDFRTNLGVLYMHAGMEVEAQIQFELACRLDETFVPAMVNLTVMLERLGQSARARELAGKACAQDRTVPMAVFNEAWYLNQEGKFQEADDLLLPLARAGLKDKYQELWKLNRRQAGMSVVDVAAMPLEITEAWNLIRNGGVAGIFDVRGSMEGRAVAVVLFCLGAFILLSLVGRIARTFHLGRRGADVIFWLFALTGWALYVVVWGMPSGFWWWALSVGFGLLCGGIAGAAMEKSKVS